MLSVLIVNWNTRDLLSACLDSLAKHPPLEPYEVIVVENASCDDSAAMIRKSGYSCTLIEPGANLGYAEGNNRAFAEASGEWLLTLNPDTEFEDDSLQRSLELLKRHPEVGAMAVRLLGPNGEVQPSVRGFPSLMGLFGEITGVAKLWPSSAFGSYSQRHFDYSKDGPADQPMGTYLLFRREALAAVGDPKHPFDEAFPIFFNEVDLLCRMKQAGWGCWFAASCHVRHLHGGSTRQVRRSMIWESHKSLLRYFKKHLRGWRRALLPGVALAVYVGAFLRAKGYDAGFRA